MKRMPGESCGKDSSKVSKAHCVLDKMLALFARVAQDISTGTQFICFTSTKVQILTPDELRGPLSKDFGHEDVANMRYSLY